jgi:aminopeptidase-like protein
MLLSNVMAYSDGEHDLLAIADLLQCPIFEVRDAALALREQGLLEPVTPSGVPPRLT